MTPLTHADLAPAPPVLDSTATAPAPRAPLLRVEGFEVGPGRIPAVASALHMLLIPAQDAPLAAITVRDGARHDLELGPGDIVVTPAGTTASWSWNAPVSVLLVWIDPEVLRDFVSHELQTLVIDSDLAHRVTINDPALTAAAMRLRDAVEEGGLGAGVVLDALARVFLVTLVRGHARRDVASLGGGLDAERYGRLARLIDERLGGRIAVGELAAEAGMSATGLARALKAATGGTASELILRARLARARELMADRARSLTEIAAACGFADQAHLSRVFKARHGVPPRVWRARHSSA